MEVQATSTPNGHHLTPIPDAGPRGPTPNERTSPPFPRQPRENDRQRFTGTPTRQQMERPAHPPPPSQGRWPAHCLGGQLSTDTRPRELAADQRPAQAVGGKPTQNPPPRAGRNDTGPGHGHRPPDQLGPYTTGFPTPAATRPSRKGAEDAPLQREHAASGPSADTEMIQTSGSQESVDPMPATAACSMPQQREPSTGNVPGGHPGTAPGHPSPAGATPDQDRETMPPPAPRPPQPSNTGPFDDAELRALYGIHATAPPSELVAALREQR